MVRKGQASPGRLKDIFCHIQPPPRNTAVTYEVFVPVGVHLPKGSPQWTTKCPFLANPI